MNTLEEMKEYMKQLVHLSPVAFTDIVKAYKNFEECLGDDTQSYWEYTGLDSNDDVVLIISVDMNNNAELVEDYGDYYGI